MRGIMSDNPKPSFRKISTELLVLLFLWLVCFLNANLRLNPDTNFYGWPLVLPVNGGEGYLYRLAVNTACLVSIFAALIVVEGLIRRRETRPQ